jgi:hypothetical protein
MVKSITSAWMNEYIVKRLLNKRVLASGVRIGPRRPRKKKNANRKRDRSFGLHHLQELNNREFRVMYRMTRPSFYKLFSLIEGDLTVNEAQAKRSSGSAIPAISKLAATIRWLAGGSYLDIASLFGLDKINFFNQKYGPLWKTVKTLDSRLQLGLDLSKDNLEKTAAEFSKFSKYTMNNCVMAIDGLVVKTRKPTKRKRGILKLTGIENVPGGWLF